MAKGKRPSNDINASSMADIAFLLLIFFLVTTTIDVDKGILHKLPRWDPDVEQEEIIFHKRNTFVVLINARDQLLVNGEIAQVATLRSKAKEFINNRNRNPNLSVNPQKAVVSLQNDRGTSYDIYLQVQNELKAAYRELRDDYGMYEYQMTYSDIKLARKKARKSKNNAGVQKYTDMLKVITKEYPMRLSEAEPKEIGEG